MLVVRKPVLGTAGASDTPITTVTTSTGVAVNDLDAVQGINCQIAGITTGTVDIESTLDGTVWQKEGSSLTADGRVKISSPVAAVRANVKVATTVSVKLTVAGQQVQGAGGVHS